MKWYRVVSVCAASLLFLAVFGSGKPPAAIEVTNVSSLPGQPKLPRWGVAYWVSIDAPLASMPIGAANAAICGDELTSWLEHYAISLEPQKILLQNTSSVSQRIRIQPTGEDEFNSRPGIVVQCGDPSQQVQEDHVLPGAVSYDSVALVVNGLSAGAYTDQARTNKFEQTLQPGEQSGMSVRLFGSAGFSGEIFVTSEGTGIITNSTIPLRLGASGVGSAFRWPGIRGQELVRVSFQSGGKMYCQRASEKTLGNPCDPTMLRNEALTSWNEVTKARVLIENEARSPAYPIPTTDTRTKIIRLSPWLDTSLAQKTSTPADSVVSKCSQIDSYRVDRINCSGGQRCYVNADLEHALCPSADLSQWRSVRVNGKLTLLPEARKNDSIPFSFRPLSLRLGDGSWCTVGAAANSDPPQADFSWAGICRMPGADQYRTLWKKASGNSSQLGQEYLLPQDDENYLQVAVGIEGQAPKKENVTEIYY